MAELAMPAFLRWSESTITFDRTDHPESIPQSGRYPLMIDPIISMKWPTKVLMDGGSGLNIMYAKMLDAMGIDRSRIQLTRAPFHGIVPGKQVMPRGSNQLQDGDPYIQGGWVPWNLPRHPRTSMLREVHGRPQLHLSEVEDARSMRGHHHRTSFQRTYECKV